MHCLQVLSPPYMCNRSSVWLALCSYMTSFFLMRCKSRNQAILSHMEMPADHSENILVSCLIELTMELYSLGFLFAACNTSLLAILQNEVSARASIFETRYELVGQFVDVNVRSPVAATTSLACHLNRMLCKNAASLSCCCNGRRGRQHSPHRRLACIHHAAWQGKCTQMPHSTDADTNECAGSGCDQAAAQAASGVQ